MDVTETIRQMKIEKARIEQAIAVLEELLTSRGSDPTHIPKRQGRKSMPLQERRAVSARMKKYWANRRRGQPD